MFQIDVLTLIAFFGTLQGILFSAVFWVRKKSLQNRLFALLLLVTSVRIAKNIFVHLRELNPELFSDVELWRTAVYMGLSHQFAIGPLFLLYFQARLMQKFSWKSVYGLHFLPYAIMIIASPFLTWDFWASGGLWLSYISITIYFVWSFAVYHKNRHRVGQEVQRWCRTLLIVTGILLFIYSPALFHYIGYAGGACLYAVAILSIGFMILTDNGRWSFFRNKYASSGLDHTQTMAIQRRLNQLMTNEKPFLDPGLTLAKLAKMISISPHQLSRVINEKFKMGFSDYVNQFRIEEAMRRLHDEQYEHLKMAALAYDCGFNSVPTFNTFFKKVNKMTPSEYKAQAPGKRVS